MIYQKGYGMDRISFVLVPFWIENVLKRNKLSCRDLLQYDTVRSLMSVEDTASLLATQSCTKLKMFENYNNILLSSWEKSNNPKSRYELGSTVTHLSCSEDIRTSVFNRLVSDEYPQDDSDKFKIIDIDRNIFCIVLYEGFITSMIKEAMQLNLIRDILKISYMYRRVHEVSEYPIFDDYLNLLNRSAYLENAT